MQSDVLWLEDQGEVILEEHIRSSPRVGLAYAGSEAANLPWRFRIVGSQWTSKAT
jgi:DNA-3-methyladenine glycosylase